VIEEMRTASTSETAQHEALLERARGGEQLAFARRRDREVFERYPDEPVDAAKVDDVFARFGLPAELD
jgi:hypothetical protein